MTVPIPTVADHAAVAVLEPRRRWHIGVAAVALLAAVAPARAQSGPPNIERAVRGAPQPPAAGLARAAGC